MISTMRTIAIKICIPAESRLDLEPEEGHLSSARVKKELKNTHKSCKSAKKRAHKKNTDNVVKDLEGKKGPKSFLRKCFDLEGKSPTKLYFHFSNDEYNNNYCEKNSLNCRIQFEI